ncbi:MAG: hypothetical protein A4E62_00190 [Syntrophorhabdus sp. PtaU1.Bin002]|nr:MAG: hypothetical protein A4E62_00190 [Syntrophorhabdus sp. PtaU1.Bin002]
MVTGIGSFPFDNVDEAIDLIFSTCREIPFWPQLPKRAPFENMYIPFLQGVPCVVIDEQAGSAFVNSEESEGIETFYENVQDENLEAFRISEKVAPGFYRFLERLKEIENDVRFIKAQLTGPFSMGLGLKDENGKPIIYNYAYFDIIKKALQMKAKWMVATIKDRYPEKDVILFFDEPYLVSFGSAYVSISKEEAISIFDEVLGGIKARRGIHCCGNTDWSVLLNADVDIINYDAFNFMETIFYFKDDLTKFLTRGGLISPGLVPSSEQVSTTSVNDIKALWKGFEERMAGFDGVFPRDVLITTSCGVGSLKAEEAVRAMELLRGLTQA